jgi:hypothetical protein
MKVLSVEGTDTTYATDKPVARTCRLPTVETLVMFTELPAGATLNTAAVNASRNAFESLVTPDTVCTNCTYVGCTDVGTPLVTRAVGASEGIVVFVNWVGEAVAGKRVGALDVGGVDGASEGITVGTHVGDKLGDVRVSKLVPEMASTCLASVSELLMACIFLACGRICCRCIRWLLAWCFTRLT